MGPRPNRLTAKLVVEPVPLRPVQVVKLRSRSVPAPDTAPLPEPVRDALAAIATDLRHLPRDAIVDKAELLVWLRRMACRVDGVAALRVLVRPTPRRPPPIGASTGRELAEAVFGLGGRRAGAQGRTVTSRRGRQVAVEIRRTRENGQTELRF